MPTFRFHKNEIIRGLALQDKDNLSGRILSSTRPAHTCVNVEIADYFAMTPSIAILGAGPSGLALARYLHIANIDFVVFERDESQTWAIGRGGTLDLHTSTGQVALQEIGLLDQFKALARLDVTNVVADANGKVCFKTSEKVDSDRPEIDRKDLRAMLLSSIPTEKVRWASRVQQVDRVADGSVSIRFADGSSESGFRLVVGADGAWSKARSVVSA